MGYECREECEQIDTNCCTKVERIIAPDKKYLNAFIFHIN